MSNFNPALRAPNTFDHFLRHVIGTRGFPPIRIQIPAETPPTPSDVALAERIMRTWYRAVSDERRVSKRPFEDVWEMVQHEFHGEFVAALRSKDPVAVAAILNNFFRHNISYGMGGGRSLYEAVLTEGGNAPNACLTVDRLASLADALGLLPVENPEQGRWGESLHVDPAELAARIEAKLGIPVCPPTVCGFYGIPLNSGFMMPTTCNQLYAAYRLQTLATDAPRRRVCEIGGGYGGCTYYSYLLGLRDYWLFDLPISNAFQGYYLSKTLPSAKIAFYGEDDTRADIRILPYWKFQEQPDAWFGVALNQDSLPEIMPDLAIQYLRDLGRTSFYFLSINQESQGNSCRLDLFQTWVSEMAERSGALRRIARYPFWLRAGYVEEIYRGTGK